MNVKKKQCLLFCLGYDPGEIDGIDGANTRYAMYNFTKDYGVGESGLIPALAGTIKKKDNPTFWDGIKYFDRDEYRCKCGKCGGFPVEPDETLVKVEDRVRAILGKPIRNSSGVRCEAHNKKVGGVPRSLHLAGKAVDFCCPGKTSKEILKVVRKQPEITYAYCIDQYYVHMNVKR